MKPINKAQVLDHLTYQLLNNDRVDHGLNNYIKASYKMTFLELKAVNPKKLLRIIKEYYSQPEIKLNAKLEQIK